MSTVKKMEAHELTDASVAFISLVDRGANREPFRIKKQGDTQMIDLTNGLKGLFQKREARKPEVALVAFAKGYDTIAAVALMKAAGLEAVGEPIDDEDALVIPTMEGLTSLESVVLYKLSDDVAVGIRFDEPEVVRKGFSGYDYESTSYKDVLGTNTTMPMINVAASALMDTVWNIMANSDTVAVAKADIKAAIKDFGGMIDEIVARVPASAFKLEAVASKTVTAKADAQGQASGTKKPAEATEAAVVAKAEDAPAADAAAAVAKPEAVAEGAKAPEAAAPVVVDKAEGTETLAPVLAALKKMGDTLSASINAVSEQVIAQGAKLATVETAIADTKTQIAKMDEELGTGVIAGAAEGEKARLAKGDEGDDGDDGEFLVLDTAYGNPFDDKEIKRVA